MCSIIGRKTTLCLYLALNSTAKSWRYIREKIIHRRSKVLFGDRVRIRKSYGVNHHYRRRDHHRLFAILGLNKSPVIVLSYRSRRIISECTFHAIGFIVSCINISITFNLSAAIHVTIISSTESFCATWL